MSGGQARWSSGKLGICSNSSAVRPSGFRSGAEKLVDALESFDHLEAGIAPKITFAPNRHVGTDEAYFLIFDAARQAFVP